MSYKIERKLISQRDKKDVRYFNSRAEAVRKLKEMYGTLTNARGLGWKIKKV